MKAFNIRAVASLAILGLLFILPGCGDDDDDDDDPFVCTPNGNIALSVSSMTFDATQGGALPSPQPVDVSFPNGILPAGNVAAAAVIEFPGMEVPSWTRPDIPGATLTNPTQFDIYIDQIPGVGTYSYTYYFAAFDINTAMVGCITMPVTYNVNP